MEAGSAGKKGFDRNLIESLRTSGILECFLSRNSVSSEKVEASQRYSSLNWSR